MKRFILTVLDKAINVQRVDSEDYICLTDMVKGIENGPSLVEKMAQEQEYSRISWTLGNAE